MYKIAEHRIIQCPFNRYHVVSSLRIQKHIIKCQKNHPEVQFISCVYNFSHKIKPLEILEHYRACPFKVETCNFDTEESNLLFDESIDVENLNSSSENIKTNISAWESSLSLSSSDSLDSKFETIFIDSDTSFTDIDDDEELKPLPIPEIPSKAFTFGKTNEKKVERFFQVPNTLSDEDSISSLSLELSWKKCRRKNILVEGIPGPFRKSDHSFPPFKVDDCNSRKSNSKESNSSYSSYSELEDYSAQAAESDETSEDSSNACDLKSYVKIKKSNSY